SDVQEFLERTSHVLSLVSSGVGVALATSGSSNALEHVYFSRLGDQKILAVVVTRSGVVRDRVFRLQRDISQADLELAANYLDDKQEAVRVVIGLEETAPELRNFVLIGAPARVNGEVIGSLAILGPTRIDYQSSMSAVSYIATLFDRILYDTDESK